MGISYKGMSLEQLLNEVGQWFPGIDTAMDSWLLLHWALWELANAQRKLAESEKLERRVRELEGQLGVALDALAGLVEEHCPARKMVHHGHSLANQEAFMVLEQAGRMRSDVNLDVFWLLTEAEREELEALRNG